jgi:hypothetical protein
VQYREASADTALSGLRLDKTGLTTDLKDSANRILEINVSVYWFIDEEALQHSAIFISGWNGNAVTCDLEVPGQKLERRSKPVPIPQDLEIDHSTRLYILFYFP